MTRGVRTRNPSKRAAAFPLLRPLGHWCWYICISQLGWFSRYSDSLLTLRFADRNPVGAGFSGPVQTGSEAHSNYRVSFPEVKRPGRDAGLYCCFLSVFSWHAREKYLYMYITFFCNYTMQCELRYRRLLPQFNSSVFCVITRRKLV